MKTKSNMFTFLDLQDKRTKLTDYGRLVLKDCYLQAFHRVSDRSHADVWFEAVQDFLATTENAAKDSDDDAKDSSDS